MVGWLFPEFFAHFNASHKFPFAQNPVASHAALPNFTYRLTMAKVVSTENTFSVRLSPATPEP